MSKKRVYGIDLGTTYSCISRVDDHGRPEVIANSDNELTTASVVYLETSDNVVVGQAAKDVAQVYPNLVISAVKRAMGDVNTEYFIHGKTYHPQEISAFILRKLADDAEKVTGEKVTDVVITCPAYFGLNQKEATRQAGTIAGLNVLYVIPEPTAAAIAFGTQQESDQTILVYDLGGGTFDITLIEIKQGSITVIATGGDNQLGGKDWDDRIVQAYANAFEQSTGTPASQLTGDLETYQELLNAAEKAKKKLSSAKSHTEIVRFGAKREKVELTREKFDELTDSLLSRTVSLTEDMIERACQRGYTRIDKILLVGGSTYMPQVIDRMAKFNSEVKQFDPHLAVAKGAAIFGYKCFLDEQIKIQIAGNTGRDASQIDLDNVSERAKDEAIRKVAIEQGIALPDIKKLAKTKITNVTSKSFGIVVMDPEQKIEVVSNLIFADEAVPRDVSRTYGTYEDNQQGVELRLMENDQRIDSGERVEISKCRELAKAEITFARALPISSPIEVNFRLSPDGMLKMDARDQVTGGVAHVELTVDCILSREEEEKARKSLVQIAVS